MYMYIGGGGGGCGIAGAYLAQKSVIISPPPRVYLLAPLEQAKEVIGHAQGGEEDGARTQDPIIGYFVNLPSSLLLLPNFLSREE